MPVLQQAVYSFTGQFGSWADLRPEMLRWHYWPGFCQLSVLWSVYSNGRADCAIPNDICQCQVDCVDYWNVSLWEELQHIFWIGIDQKKIEENKVNVNLTKIVNDYENIPTSDTSSNMLYLLTVQCVLFPSFMMILCIKDVCLSNIFTGDSNSLLQG